MPKPERAKVLEVFCVLGLAGVLLTLLTHNRYILVACAVVLLLGLFGKGLAATIAGAWLWLSEQLGRITTGILLAVVFFGLLTPVALLFRLFHRDSLQLKRPADQAGRSYFKVRRCLYQRADLENPW